MKQILEVTITEELVIRYNIESHVSFAEDENRNIFPNASFPGAFWRRDDRGKYGGHSATQAAKGGYSLVVGAEALIKITHRFGEKKEVHYKPYYGPNGNHHDREHPAALLNSWAAIHLSETYSKYIPYTDQAATFFHNLIMGMAQISRRIQEATFEQDKLLELIEGNNFLLPKL
jgi:hypothetical protein